MFRHGEMVLLPHARRNVRHRNRTRRGNSSFPFHFVFRIRHCIFSTRAHISSWSRTRDTTSIRGLNHGWNRTIVRVDLFLSSGVLLLEGKSRGHETAHVSDWKVRAISGFWPVIRVFPQIPGRPTVLAPCSSCDTCLALPYKWPRLLLLSRFYELGCDMLKHWPAAIY